MNKQLSQMNSLVDLLLDFDMHDFQPLEKRQALYFATLTMINNPDIYGDVFNIAVEIHNQISIDDNFNVTINPDMKYAEYAFKLCEYLSVDD